MKRFTTFLERLNHSDHPPEAQSPFQASAIAALISFLLIYFLDSRQVSSVRNGWVQLLLYGFVPILLAFIILYRSSWHREMRRAARALLLALLSCLIFPGVLIATLIAMCLVALVYSCYVDHFLRFH